MCTQKSCRIGTSGWAHRLDAHERAAARIVSDNAGTIVKSTGNGLLATFDSFSASLEASMAMM